MTLEALPSVRSPLAELETLLGQENVVTDPAALGRLARNTLGVERRLLAAVRPSVTAEVVGVVAIANRHHLALYPVGRGRNIGYGERAPAADGQVLVDLGRMNRIRSLDRVGGTVVVEPGVTQRQLYEFLTASGAPFWMDVTGSATDSSIVGNTLEGGFGHSPVGNRRSLIAGVEVVLGDGTVLDAGTFPGLGPDLNGLFVQSNLGIVTALEVTLFPAPERYLSFLARVDDDGGLEALVGRVAFLRRQGTLTGLVHIANAMRSMISTMPLPARFRDRLMTPADAVTCMSTPFAKAGRWTAFGGLYGSRRRVAASRWELGRALRGVAAVQYVGDGSLRRMRRLLAVPLVRGTSAAAKGRLGLQALQFIHDLGRGVPSDQGLQGVPWRIEDPDAVGFFWSSATVPAVPRAAREAVVIAEGLFDRHGFEMPLTLTFVKPTRLVVTMSCTFDLRDAGQRVRAHELYFALHGELARAGFPQYRSSILGTRDIRYEDRGKRVVLDRLKRGLDPNGVMAPGRYGIS